MLLDLNSLKGYNFNTLKVVKVDEEKRATFAEHGTPLPEDFSDGFYIVATKISQDSETPIMKGEFSSDDFKSLAVFLLGPVESEEEIEGVIEEIQDVADRNPNVDVLTVFKLWDHEYNVSDLEDKQYRQSLN